MYRKTIEKYSLSHYSGNDERNYSYRSIIGLKDGKDALIGVLYFHRDESTVPEKDSMSPDGYPLIHYPDAEYDIILDILRNESPVIIQFVEGGWNIGNIRTNNEPIGEGEAK